MEGVLGDFEALSQIDEKLARIEILKNERAKLTDALAELIEHLNMLEGDTTKNVLVYDYETDNEYAHLRLSRKGMIYALKDSIEDAKAVIRDINRSLAALLNIKTTNPSDSVIHVRATQSGLINMKKP